MTLRCWPEPREPRQTGGGPGSAWPPLPCAPNLAAVGCPRAAAVGGAASLRGGGGGGRVRHGDRVCPPRSRSPGSSTAWPAWALLPPLLRPQPRPLRCLPRAWLGRAGLELQTGFRKVVFFLVKCTVSGIPRGISTQFRLVVAEGYCRVRNAPKRLLQVWLSCCVIRTSSRRRQRRGVLVVAPGRGPRSGERVPEADALSLAWSLRSERKDLAQ